MSNVRVAVEHLRLGMYVSELDRPWLDTPFLFQGFPLVESAQIAQLREYCQWVWVDVELTPHEVASHIVPYTGQVAAPQSRKPRQKKTPPRRRTQAFQQVLQRAATARAASRRVLDRLFDDIRLGHSIDTQDARLAVRRTVEVVTDHMDAALWLTNLKNRDEYTSIHCLNVCVLAVAFARHLGYDAKSLEVIGLGALLHDIGKIDIPDEVLNKPGPLSEDEWTIMRLHPVSGHGLLADSGHVEPLALDIVRLHHERIDGRGYPDGLAGDAIHECVLIAAIADVYDAMTSDRPYHRAVPPQAALDRLFKMAPHAFGEELVEEFIRCIGIYPIGSLVELNNHHLGVVIATDPEHRLSPQILMVRDQTGAPYAERKVVDLAEMDDDSMGAWGIDRVADPQAHGMDLLNIVREELQGARLRVAAAQQG